MKNRIKSGVILLLLLYGTTVFWGCKGEEKKLPDGGVQNQDDGEMQNRENGEAQNQEDGETLSRDDGEVQNREDGETLRRENGEVQNRQDEIEENGKKENRTGKNEDNQELLTGIAHETAADAEIDFGVLQSENPDIFAWLQIPGTDIDVPVLQSEEADNFYETHNAYGKEDEAGAVYTELANLKNMCDFNTVIHGKSGKDGRPFSELYYFADPDFFKEHEKIYLYLEDNLLTYEVFAAFEREDASLIRTYDFTYRSGCQEFLNDLYDVRSMGKNIREGWEEVTPYHFLITLTTQSPQKNGRQFVVVAALTEDAAGTIDRLVEE